MIRMPKNLEIYIYPIFILFQIPMNYYTIEEIYHKKYVSFAYTMLYTFVVALMVVSTTIFLHNNHIKLNQGI